MTDMRLVGLDPLVTASITTTNGFTVLVDAADLPLVQRYTWRAEPRNNSTTLYAVRHIPRGDIATPPTRYMHKLLTGWDRTDHANGNGLDNTKANLRRASQSQNMANTRSHRGGTSRYRGVSWAKRGRCWRAQICTAGHSMSLGDFNDEDAAARAYDEAARERFGEFAALNFPKPGERSAVDS